MTLNPKTAAQLLEAGFSLWEQGYTVKPLGPEDLMRLSRLLKDEGRLIDAGFVEFWSEQVEDGSPPDLMRKMREGFFTGAEYVLDLIADLLLPAEAGRPDLSEGTIVRAKETLTQMSTEIEAFVDTLTLDTARFRRATTEKD